MSTTTRPSLLSTAWAPSLPAPGSGAVVHVVLADPSRWQAAWQRWRSRLHGHRLHLQRAAHYAAHARLPESLHGDWQALFTHRARRDGDAPCAWLPAQAALSRVHARLLADLGVDRRHLRHLRQQTWYPAGVTACLSAQDQRLDCRLVRSVRITPTSVLLVVKTAFVDGASTLVALVEDSYVVRRLPPADAAQAGDDAVLRRAIARLRQRAPALDAAEAGARSVRLLADAAAARAFTRLAGELCGGQRSGAAARLQGVHLRGLVARELSRFGLAVSRLSITFVAHVPPGQPLCLVQCEERYEVTDAASRLVAFGRF